MTTNIYYQWVGNGICEAFAFINGKRMFARCGGAAAKFDAIDAVRLAMPARHTHLVVRPSMFVDKHYTRPLDGKVLDVLRAHAVDCQDQNRPLKHHELVAQICHDYVTLAEHRAFIKEPQINVDSLIDDMYGTDQLLKSGCPLLLRSSGLDQVATDLGGLFHAHTKRCNATCQYDTCCVDISVQG